MGSDGSIFDSVTSIAPLPENSLVDTLFKSENSAENYNSLVRSMDMNSQQRYTALTDNRVEIDPALRVAHFAHFGEQSTRNAAPSQNAIHAAERLIDDTEQTGVVSVDALATAIDQTLDMMRSDVQLGIDVDFPINVLGDGLSTPEYNQYGTSPKSEADLFRHIK